MLSAISGESRNATLSLSPSGSDPLQTKTRPLRHPIPRCSTAYCATKHVVPSRLDAILDRKLRPRLR